MSKFSRLFPRFLRGDKDKYVNDAGELVDKSVCKILLLDETDLTLPFKGNFKGQTLLDKVFDHLNLLEKDYFGLRYLDQARQTHWLESQKSLSSQIKQCNLPYTLYFGVKFYPADPCKLREEITRYQFFLQVKKDILDGRLPITFDEASELFAYAVQSEIGDYDPNRLPPDYVSEFRFVPNQTEELEARIGAFHRKLGGHTPAAAEYKFLDKVKWLDMYGVDLHPVMGEGNTEYFLGLTPTGIVVYKNKTKVGNYFWPRVTKVTFKGKVFIIRVRDKINDEHTYAFELVTKPGCKHLYKCCVEHHAFFRINQLGESSLKSGSKKSSANLFKASSSKLRSSGRQSRQNNFDQHNRSQPSVIRVPSRRQARRTLSDPRLNAQMGYDSGVDGAITLMVMPEPVKGSRHRSLPDLKGRESPTSTRSAPWETNMDDGLYTSGRESPVSVTQSERINRRNRDSDSESGYRRNRHGYRWDYESDIGYNTKQIRTKGIGYSEHGEEVDNYIEIRKKYHHHRHHHHHRHSHRSSHSIHRHNSGRSGYDSEPASGRQRKHMYFPRSTKGSDNESEVSFSRRRRRDGDSGSESDVSPSRYAARQRKTKSVGADAFEAEWKEAMQHVYLAGKENRANGSIPSLHSAPAAEARQKRQRRRRSKSPSSNKRPPEELRQHIEFELVDPAGMTEEELREIPFTRVETKAEAFKIRYSPKTRQRYRSPKRKAFGEVDQNIKSGYMSEEPPPPYTPPTQSPNRTPEVPHRTVKSAGYYSDTNARNPGRTQSQVSAPSYRSDYEGSPRSHYMNQYQMQNLPSSSQNGPFYHPNDSLHSREHSTVDQTSTWKNTSSAQIQSVSNRLPVSTVPVGSRSSSTVSTVSSGMPVMPNNMRSVSNHVSASSGNYYSVTRPQTSMPVSLSGNAYSMSNNVANVSRSYTSGHTGLPDHSSGNTYMDMSYNRTNVSNHMSPVSSHRTPTTNYVSSVSNNTSVMSSNSSVMSHNMSAMSGNRADRYSSPYISDADPYRSDSFHHKFPVNSTRETQPKSHDHFIDQSKCSTPEVTSETGSQGLDNSQGHDLEDDTGSDRTRDSGLSSSHGTTGRPFSPPSNCGRMYGTQDAIARLYSSPGGVRRLTNTENQSASPSSSPVKRLTYNQSVTSSQGYSPSISSSYNQGSPPKPQMSTFKEGNSYSNSPKVPARNYASRGYPPHHSVNDSWSGHSGSHSYSNSINSTASMNLRSQQSVTTVSSQNYRSPGSGKHEASHNSMFTGNSAGNSGSSLYQSPRSSSGVSSALSSHNSPRDGLSHDLSGNERTHNYGKSNIWTEL